ncbi:glycosyltransferase family 4 protein [Acinetobacter rathckeae]|uniref:glycosyltransferase family 4 protein n=1 Tax=Acinetobacter rathckeae TaxID=2605272 RepID=UPI0018A29ADF|nr:glycosyltransferase family 1 protein [Acinetobacter rathckeae]MBF7696387.1 glycosyltransferase family 4 protein [Acinetobacter rathckeae]
MNKTSLDNRIIFDTRWFGQTGIGRFAEEMYDDSFFRPIQLKNNPAGVLEVIQLTWYLLWNKSFFYSPGFNAPLFFLNRVAITIHDLNHIDIDSNTSILKKIYYNLVLKRACRKAALIFTVSEFSKKRIIEWSGVSENKVVVTYNGVSSTFNTQVTPYTPEYKYIFIVGNRKKHKNEEVAIRAIHAASIDQNIKILVSGKSSEDLVTVIKELNMMDRVIFLGKLSELELASTYKGAICLLFPSLYEGFGLPVIEAMACGTPVITSKTTSLGEVSGDAAYLVNPSDINDITDALNTVINSNKVQKDLREKGLVQCSKFSWSNSKKVLIEELLS